MVILFGRALLTPRSDRRTALLLPFYAVFLPAGLADPGPRSRATTTPDASTDTSTYARLRMAQLRTSLRDLWLARWAAGLLLGLRVARLRAGPGGWAMPNGGRPQIGLLLFTLFWVLGHIRRRSQFCDGAECFEYRTMRRLITPAVR